MIAPPIFLRIMWCSKRAFPKIVAVAPKAIKIIENPKTKLKEWRTVKRFTSFFLSSVISPENSLKDTPVRYEIYPGIRGNIHGDKKISMPAPKAAKKDMLSMFIRLPSLEPQATLLFFSHSLWIEECNTFPFLEHTPVLHSDFHNYERIYILPRDLIFLHRNKKRL